MYIYIYIYIYIYNGGAAAAANARKLAQKARASRKIRAPRAKGTLAATVRVCEPEKRACGKRSPPNLSRRALRGVRRWRSVLAASSQYETWTAQTIHILLLVVSLYIYIYISIHLSLSIYIYIYIYIYTHIIRAPASEREGCRGRQSVHQQLEQPDVVMI